jgi:hypothetical protein
MCLALFTLGTAQHVNVGMVFKLLPVSMPLLLWFDVSLGSSAIYVPVVMCNFL